MEESKKNVVGYIRVSTDNQCKEDKFGLEVQREQIESYCAANGMEIVRWYQDRGESGAKERPGFDEICYGDVTNPPFEAVVVAKSDRVARDINIYYFYKMLLRKKDVSLISVSEDFGQFGVFAPMLESFTLCVAAMERENINKRTSAGRAVKAKQGGYSGGRAPFGYRVENKSLVQIKDLVPYIVEMFRMRDNGDTLEQIADYLNENGVVTSRGSKFYLSSVRQVLNNRKFYEGFYRYGEGSEWVPGQHEPILPSRDDGKKEA